MPRRNEGDVEVPVVPMSMYPNAAPGTEALSRTLSFANPAKDPRLDVSSVVVGHHDRTPIVKVPRFDQDPEVLYTPWWKMALAMLGPVWMFRHGYKVTKRDGNTSGNQRHDEIPIVCRTCQYWLREALTPELPSSTTGKLEIRYTKLTWRGWMLLVGYALGLLLLLALIF